MTTQVPDTVTSMLMRALSDPGSITERKTLHVDWDGTPAQESLTAWQARAVLEIVPPLIARAERERILVSDETVHADGSIGPDAVPPGFPLDPAYWYRRWLFLAKMLDEEAARRISHYVGMGDKLADGGRLAERERIRQGLMERQAILAYVWTSRQVNAVLVRDIEHVLDGP